MHLDGKLRRRKLAWRLVLYRVWALVTCGWWRKQAKPTSTSKTERMLSAITNQSGGRNNIEIVRCTKNPKSIRDLYNISQLIFVVVRQHFLLWFFNFLFSSNLTETSYWLGLWSDHFRVVLLPCSCFFPSTRCVRSTLCSLQASCIIFVFANSVHAYSIIYVFFPNFTLAISAIWRKKRKKYTAKRKRRKC